MSILPRQEETAEAWSLETLLALFLLPRKLRFSPSPYGFYKATVLLEDRRDGGWVVPSTPFHLLRRSFYGNDGNAFCPEN